MTKNNKLGPRWIAFISGSENKGTFPFSLPSLGQISLKMRVRQKTSTRGDDDDDDDRVGRFFSHFVQR